MSRRRAVDDITRRLHELRAQSVDPIDVERRAFEDVLARGSLQPADLATLYEDYLVATSHARRRSHGVYYTPPALVRAQVRLIDDVLRRELQCPSGFADRRVAIVDPATGSGAYPRAILEQVGGLHAAEVQHHMWLFEAAPGAAVVARARGLAVRERDALETHLALDAPIVVCLGNPPYRRARANGTALDDIADPAQAVHRKNLYNAYVYFWRWALRTVFELRAGSGVVSFVTASSYLRGPAFGGLRRLLRRLVDNLWVIDLEGDHLAARASENVFAIRTPIAIATAVRRGASAAGARASINYARLGGSRTEKLARLESLRCVADLEWNAAADGWAHPFTPASRTAYTHWPALTELFPWQTSGAQLKRTWPIGITPEVLQARWRRFVELPVPERIEAFVATRDRDLDSSPPDLLDPSVRLMPLRDLAACSPCLEPIRYAYRSFDRQWVLPDTRLGDFMRPSLWRTVGPRQVFLTSLLTNVLGPGPAAVATASVPDLDHFRGSFGARAVIPLWRDAAATCPNVSGFWLARLADLYGFTVEPTALMAYCYAVLAQRAYFDRFAEELRTPGPRIPLTNLADVFGRGVALGADLLALHTYQHVASGDAREIIPIGGGYPARFAYDARRGELAVGEGAIEPVSREAWEYSVSGYRVVGGWLRRRIGKRGRSPLDAIQPERWTPELTRELLELIWLIEATLSLEPHLERFLDEVLSGSCAERRLVVGEELLLDRRGGLRLREDEALPLVAAELLEAIPL